MSSLPVLCLTNSEDLLTLCMSEIHPWHDSGDKVFRMNYNTIVGMEGFKNCNFMEAAFFVMVLYPH